MVSGNLIVQPPEPPDDSGASGQRTPTPEDIELLRSSDETTGISEYPISEAIRQIEAQGVRGNAGMTLLHATVRNLENQIVQLRTERDTTAAQLETTRSALAKRETDYAVLNDRSRLASRISIVQGLLFSLGGVVVGVSLPIAINTRSVAAGFASALGGVLLVCGLFPILLKRAGT